MNAIALTRWPFRLNAGISWALSLRGIVDPAGAASMFGGPAPNYLFLVRFWSAFVFMFGCLFFEVSRDPVGKRALAKYNWIEKSITAAAVTIGFAANEVPPRMMLLICLTNWIWIPWLLFCDWRLSHPAARPA